MIELSAKEGTVQSVMLEIQRLQKIGRIEFGQVKPTTAANKTTHRHCDTGNGSNAMDLRSFQELPDRRNG